MKDFICTRFKMVIACMLIIMLLPVNGSLTAKADGGSGEAVNNGDSETSGSEKSDEEDIEKDLEEEEDSEELEEDSEEKEEDPEELEENSEEKEEDSEELEESLEENGHHETMSNGPANYILDTDDYQAATELDLQEAISQAPENGNLFTIKVMAEIELSEPIEIRRGQNIQIYSEKTAAESIISENKRHFTVEGILILENIIIDGNESGGGIEVNQGELILNEGAVINNCKVTGNDLGGGVLITQGYLSINEGAAIVNCKTLQSGGGIYADGSRININGGFITENSARFGGGIYAKNGSTLNMTEGTINENYLISDGASGAGVYIGGSDSVFTMNGGKIIDNKTYILGNTSTSPGGGVSVSGAQFNLINGIISGNRATQGGGGVSVSGKGHLKMSGGTISENLSYTASSSPANGGGVEVESGYFTMTGGTIENNEADYGGGVYVGYRRNPGSEFTFIGGTIRANHAVDYGGGIMGQYVESTINLDGGIVGGTDTEDANTAAAGGGIFLYQATANISKGSIVGNIADSMAGGVYNWSGNMNISGGNISGNTAPLGGGIYLISSGGTTVLSMTAGEISKNTALNSAGGGIYIFDSVTANISNAIIGENKAKTSGGGIYINGSTALSLKNTEISGNTAENYGGGVYLQTRAGLEAAEEVFFLNNNGGNEGGAIYTQKFSSYMETMDTNSDYTNVITADDTVFAGNTANKLYEPPANAADFLNLKFARTSANGAQAHLLNNYDINYVFETEIKAYLFAYNANDGTANPDTVQYYVKEGGSHTVKADNDSEINFTRKGYTFTGWNTEPKGSGISYKFADEINDIKEDITLYAQWKKNEESGGNEGGNEGGDHDKDRDREEPIVQVNEPEPEFLLNKEDHFAYVVGYPDKTVRPGANITRAETASIFFRLLTETARNTYLIKTNGFTDIEGNDWYNTAVSTMANAQIVAGYSDGSFGGNNYITRAEFAAIAARFDSGSYSGADKFSDIGGHWAAEEINRAAEKGWIEGYEDGTFRPNQHITRAEAVSLINRVLERDKNKSLHSDMITWIDNIIGQWYYLDIQEATNSHLYHRDNNGYEIWDEVTPIPNWIEIEKSR